VERIELEPMTDLSPKKAGDSKLSPEEFRVAPATQSQLELSIVIPSYLEEENLRILIPRVKETAAKLSPKYEVLVVDTSRAMDNTEEVCANLDVRFVRRSPTDSFGDAVRTGIKECRGHYALFMDADGSHPPEFAERIFNAKEGYDVVIASRYTSGGETENPFLLKLMSRVLNMSYALVLGLKCRDVSNSFKLYKSEDLKRLTLRCDNFDIIEEILYKMNRAKKLKILEIPFTFKKRMFGESKRSLLAFIFTYVVTLFRLRLSK